MALGCLYAGVPYCPVSPRLLAREPGLREAAPRAGHADAGPGVRQRRAALRPRHRGGRAGRRRSGAGRRRASRAAPATAFDELLATDAATPAVDAAMRATGPDTITKFLFTSGSTKLPKAVINTHRMWCANQQQMRQSMPALAEEPPVLVDWLPWNHTFGGNHNVGHRARQRRHALHRRRQADAGRHGRDPAQPARDRAHRSTSTCRPASRRSRTPWRPTRCCASNLLSRVKMFFYAGAALAQPVWDSLHKTQEAEIGERIVMGTGLGMTESGPFALYITGPDVQVRRPRPADAGHGDQADRRRRQDRGALPRPQRHARLLARARGHGRGLRRGRLLLRPATR